MSNAAPTLDTKVYAVSDNKQLSVRELLNSFQRHGIARVTDLHLKVGSPPIYRVDGNLKRTNGRPLDKPSLEAIVRVFSTEPELHTLEEHRSVNNSHLIDGMRFRINVFHDRNGVAIAIRALETAPPPVEKIGFPNRVWEDLIELRQGLVLLTGATGVGKSTTIASLVERIVHTRPVHIITLEDPIEYQLESDVAVISQRAVGRDVPSFERGIRDCLREDPDVIVVGEMTEKESATWTLTAAETGHLVFSSLHSRDAAGAVLRILDMYPPGRHEEVANQLSMGLRYVISQKLLPRQHETGRVVAMEILNCNFAVANLIRQAKPEQIYTLMQVNTRDVPEQRMRTMEQSLAVLVRAGTISALEAERAANHPQLFSEVIAGSAAPPQHGG